MNDSFRASENPFIELITPLEEVDVESESIFGDVNDDSILLDHSSRSAADLHAHLLLEARDGADRKPELLDQVARH